MVQDEPSARERQLASELRLLRGTAGLNGQDAAARLGWSPSKVSRIESGRIGISDDDLGRLLELYDVPPEKAEQMRRLARSARSKGWWDAYAGSLSPGYTNLIKLEDGSRALRCYSAVVPHALLQTPEYARHVIGSTLPKPSATEISRRVEVHRLRQTVLQREEPLRLEVVIDEAVFRRQITHPDGEVDTATMRGQWEALVDAGKLPTVRLGVLPFRAGLPPVTSGSFSILESKATDAPDVVYLENKTRIFFVEDESEVHWYTQDFDRLASLALNEDDSLAFIREELRES